MIFILLLESLQSLWITRPRVTFPVTWKPTNLGNDVRKKGTDSNEIWWNSAKLPKIRQVAVSNLRKLDMILYETLRKTKNRSQIFSHSDWFWSLKEFEIRKKKVEIDEFKSDDKVSRHVTKFDEKLLNANSKCHDEWEFDNFSLKPGQIIIRFYLIRSTLWKLVCFLISRLDLFLDHV